MQRMLYVFKTRNPKKKLPNFYLFKQNVQAQMQAIFESKTLSFPEFGQTDQNFSGLMLKRN